MWIKWCREVRKCYSRFKAFRLINYFDIFLQSSLFVELLRNYLFTISILTGSSLFTVSNLLYCESSVTWFLINFSFSLFNFQCCTFPGQINLTGIWSTGIESVPLQHSLEHSLALREQQYFLTTFKDPSYLFLGLRTLFLGNDRA